MPNIELIEERVAMIGSEELGIPNVLMEHPQFCSRS